jgi:hypothetical protein
MEKLKYLVRSRKFWAAVGGVAAVTVKALDPNFPLDESELTGLIVVLAAYIIGTGLDQGSTSPPAA